MARTGPIPLSIFAATQSLSGQGPARCHRQLCSHRGGQTGGCPSMLPLHSFLSLKAILQHQAIIDEGTMIAPIGIAVIEGEAITQGQTFPEAAWAVGHI